MELVNRAELEKKEILRAYRKLLNASKSFLKSGDNRLIRLAFEIASDAHKDQRRKSGEPYILHPLAVAQICAEEIGLGTTSIIAGLLHDTVEDTEIRLENIEVEFGKPVAKIVDGLTKIDNLNFFDEKTTSPQAENFRKMLLTLADDVRVILIKLADRLHNMRTMDSMAQHKQIKIASETKYLYAPLAHRLGLYAIKTELEDLAMKYLEPEAYRMIAIKLKQTKAKREKFILEFVEPLSQSLKISNHPFAFEIKGRPKSIHSIWNKMKKQSVEFEEVYDLFAIRIIIDTELEREKSDCWRVYSIITDFYQPNPDRLRDWISSPKANGYESLHTTVMGPGGKWVEVQIRSSRMDEIAEKGYAAHWKYKGVKSDSGGIDQWLHRISELLDNADPNSLEYVEDIKLNLYNEDIYIFTPKGELKKLPTGSTALDFAFEIHTAIGSSCIGAKVNHKIVPLSHVLANGDQVEVLTSKIQKPNRDWLNFVITGKAKTRIKQYLNESKKEQAEQGKEVLLRKFKVWKIDFNDENLQRLLAHYDLKNPNDLYYEVSKGKLSLAEIKTILTQEKPKVEKTTPKPGENYVEKVKDDTLVIDSGIVGLNYSLANCCNPIPGDNIFGFISSSGIVKVHRVNCPNAVNLLSKYGYRVVKTRWQSDSLAHDSSYLTGIKLTGLDDVGIISGITRIITDEERVNMRSINFVSKDGIFEGEIMLFVKDRTHLDHMMQRLTKLKGILKAQRFDPE